MEQLTKEMKEEIWSNFEEMQTINLATLEGDQPRVRPVTMLYHDSGFWVLTGTDDAKTQQIENKPKIEAVLIIKGDKVQGTLRIAGRADIVTDRTTRARLAEIAPFFKDYWQTPEDPGYTLIEIKPKTLEYMRPGEFLAKSYSV